jgi:hypothetical protein
VSDPVPQNPSVKSVAAAATTPTDAAGNPSPRRPGGLARQLCQPRFLVAAGLLFACAVGFNAAAQALQLHFRKQRLELRVPALDDKAAGVARVLTGPKGKWVQVTEDRPMAADLEKTLGTTQYLNRIYVNQTAITSKTVQELADLPPEAAQRVVASLSAHPEAVMRLHVAYYSGLVDTVAHVPDRCMVADGFRPTDPAVIDFTMAGPDGAKRASSYRFITFDDVTAQGRLTRNVGYLFHVNGEYTPAPQDVRARLQKLTERYGYYAKVELMTEQTGAADPAAAGKSRDAMNDFLAAVLPEVERCLPDWAAATTGQCSRRLPRPPSRRSEGESAVGSRWSTPTGAPPAASHPLRTPHY